MKLKKKNKKIKDKLKTIKITRDIRTLFEQEQEDYYKPKRVSGFWNNNYIEHESNGKNNNLLLDEYLNKIKAYLNDILIDFQNYDAWKIQLTIAINFISSKDTEEERVMYSTSNNIKFKS